MGMELPVVGLFLSNEAIDRMTIFFNSMSCFSSNTVGSVSNR